MKLFKLILPLFLMLIIGCGSASAPPISLPAPLTGKVTVSSPDDDGLIHVDGTEGAVTADSMVMAINENTATTAWMMKALDIAIRPAYASVFPDVCNLPGHACAQADSNGSFSILIPGEIGHVIVVVLIDPLTGDEISDRITRDVPQGVTPTTAVPAGIAYNHADDLMYVVLQGNSATAVHNKMLVMNLGTGTNESFDIEGFNSIGIGYQDSDGLIVLVDEEGLFFYNAPLTAQSVPSSVAISGITSIATLEYDHGEAGTGRLLWVSTSSGEFVYAVDLLKNFAVTAVKPGFDNAKLLGCRDMAASSVLIQVDFVKRVTLLCDIEENGSVVTGMRIFEFSDGGLQAPVPTIIPKSPFLALSMQGEAMKINFHYDNEIKASTILLAVNGEAAGVQSSVEVYPILVLGPGSNYELGFDADIFSFSDPLKHIVSPFSVFLSGTLGFGAVLLHDHNNEQADGIAMLDLNTNSVISRYSVGLYPNYMAMDRNRNYIYVTNKISKTIFKAALSDLVKPN